MRRFHRSLAAAAAVVLVAAATAGAQTTAQSEQSIAPGMTQEEVVKALGAPAGERTSAGHTYLFYANGCERTCGTSDVVTLDGGRVVDAVFRAPGRRYSGKSSSPAAARPSAADVDSHGAPTVATRKHGDKSATPRTRSARGGAVRIRGAAGAPAATALTQTPGLIVRPRRTPATPTLGTIDTTSRARGIADTATSTGTRFGPPLTTVPGPATPQAPGVGAPLSRDSTVRNGVALPPGASPVPFQGARLAPTDSARVVNEQRRRESSAPAVAPQPSQSRPPQ